MSERQSRPARWFVAARRLLSRGLTIQILFVLVVLLGAPYLLERIPLGDAAADAPVLAEQGSLGIQDIVRQVKEELTAVDLERIANDEAALFRVESFDLELNFVVERRSSANVGSESALLVVGRETEVGSQQVQKITIHMKVSPEVEGAEDAHIGRPESRGQVLGSRPPEGIPQ